MYVSVCACVGRLPVQAMTNQAICVSYGARSPVPMETAVPLEPSLGRTFLRRLWEDESGW